MVGTADGRLGASWVCASAVVVVKCPPERTSVSFVITCPGFLFRRFVAFAARTSGESAMPAVRGADRSVSGCAGCSAVVVVCGSPAYSERAASARQLLMAIGFIQGLRV